MKYLMMMLLAGCYVTGNDLVAEACGPHPDVELTDELQDARDAYVSGDGTLSEVRAACTGNECNKYPTYLACAVETILGDTF